MYSKKLFIIILLLLSLCTPCSASCVPSRGQELYDYTIHLHTIPEDCELLPEQNANVVISELQRQLEAELSQNLHGHLFNISPYLVNQTLLFQFAFPPNEGVDALLTISASVYEGVCDMELAIDEHLVIYFYMFNIPIQEVLKKSFKESCRKLWGN